MNSDNLLSANRAFCGTQVDRWTLGRCLAIWEPSSSYFQMKVISGMSENNFRMDSLKDDFTLRKEGNNITLIVLAQLAISLFVDQSTTNLTWCTQASSWTWEPIRRTLKPCAYVHSESCSSPKFREAKWVFGLDNSKNFVIIKIH